MAGKNREIKRFQLAVRLAGIFDDYMVFRPDMLLAWMGESTGLLTTSPPTDTPDTEWQRELWRLLVKDASPFITKLAEFMGTDLSDARLPDRIHLFGMSSLPPPVHEGL